MANFMRGFAKGVETGQRLGDMWNDASMKRELKAANGISQDQISQYTPEQAAALQDDAEKAGGVWDEQEQAYKMPTGGLQKPTNTPTFENGAYQRDGQTIAPAQRFSLGRQVQDTAFTPDQIADEKLNTKADIYSNYGKEDLAEQMRGNALTRKHQGFQIAELEGKANALKDYKTAVKQNDAYQAKLAETSAEITRGMATGDLDHHEAARRLAAVFNDVLPNGTHAFYDEDTGTLSYGGKDGKLQTLKDPSGKPEILTPDRIQELIHLASEQGAAHVQSALEVLDPNARMERIKMEQQNKQFDTTRADSREDAKTHNEQWQRNFDQEALVANRAYEEGKRQFDGSLASQEKLTRLKIAADAANTAASNAAHMAAAKISANARSQYFKTESYGTLNGEPVNKNPDGSISYVDGTKITREEAKNVKAYDKVSGERDYQPKPFSPQDAKTINEILLSDPKYTDPKTPDSIRQEMKQSLMSEFGFSKPSAPAPSLVDVAAGLKPDAQKTRERQTQPWQRTTGLRMSDGSSAHEVEVPTGLTLKTRK